MGKRWRCPRRFDANLLVIGAGSGGLVASYIAAAVGARAVLVEGDAMGGDCLNSGCIPSKALLHAARTAHTVRHAHHAGIDAGEPQMDFPRVMARVRETIAAIAPHDSEDRYRELGVDVVRGRARLTSPWSAAIQPTDGSPERTVTARHIVLATGAEPVVPPLPGLDTVDYLTSESLWSLEALPRRLVILGAGPIGCELGQAFARLGSEVTVVGSDERLLPREDSDAAEVLARGLAAEGVTLALGQRGLAVESESGENVLVTEDSDGSRHRHAFDRLLLAVGRRPRLHGYGLEELGLVDETSRQLPVDGFLRTAHPSILACGDLVGPYQFTHAAAHQAWHAAINALFSPVRFRPRYHALPWVTFTEPEIARVGLNEQEATAQGVPFEVTRYPLAELDRALIEGETEGFIKVLTRPGRDRLLGVTLVGSQAGERLAPFVLALQHGLGLKALLKTIHPYPTLVEGNRHVAGQWQRGHAPVRLLKWLARYHRWRR